MMRLGAVWAAVAASVVLAGCSSDTGDAAAASSGAPIGGATGTELAEVQILHTGNGVEPQSLDLHRSEDVSSSNIQRDLYEGLISEAPNGDLIPGAAESWTVSDDGRTYVFNLRRNGRWSNGDAVTAADFVYGFRRGVDPKTLSVYSFILSPVLNADDITLRGRAVEDLGIRAIDDYTLEITLANPTPYFLGLLTHSMAYPLHRASFELHGDQHTRPGNLVGNGAYRLAEWMVQSHIKVVRNRHYWDDANTKLEEVWFYPTEDLNSELQRYRAGELDLTYDIPSAQLPLIRSQLASELKISPYLGSYYYGFNVTRPPFKDNPNLRRALSRAVNRDIIANQSLGAGEIP